MKNREAILIAERIRAIIDREERRRAANLVANAIRKICPKFDEDFFFYKCYLKDED
jgi:hypothetical protein